MGDWYNPFSWDMTTNANVPTTYTDRALMMDYSKQGMGPNGIVNQRAPQLAMGDDPFRRAQLQQMGQLQGIASGQQQGAGELAAQRQIQNALAAQQAQARLARGGNAAPAYRDAANQSAALGVSGAGMGQQAALQDQQAAHGMLGTVGAQGRAGDYATANANAGYQAQQQGQNAQNYLQLMNQLGNMNANELNAANTTARDANTKSTNLLGGLLSQGGQIAGAIASDERLKTEVRSSGAEIDKMLDGLRATSWKYKDPAKHGAGEWDGIIAQDLERSRAGARIVQDTPGGKMLDEKKALSATLAATARLNERLRALERKAGR